MMTSSPTQSCSWRLSQTQKRKMGKSLSYFIFVRTRMIPDEAFKRLNGLDEKWWLDASSEAGRICIHLELV